MSLLVPAYPGCPGSKAVKRSLLFAERYRRNSQFLTASEKAPTLVTAGSVAADDVEFVTLTGQTEFDRKHSCVCKYGLVTITVFFVSYFAFFSLFYFFLILNSLFLTFLFFLFTMVLPFTVNFSIFKRFTNSIEKIDFSSFLVVIFYPCSSYITVLLNV